jgi:hypothetical protein
MAPLIAPTVARKLPASEPAQNNVDVPEPPDILVEDSVQKRLVELVVILSVTVLVNPSSETTMMVELFVPPAFAFTLAGLAAI